MAYRVEVHSGVNDYLRGLEGLTRQGRLALNGFMDALRDYGDEAREGCPRKTPDSTVFRLRCVREPLEVVERRRPVLEPSWRRRSSAFGGLRRRNSASWRRPSASSRFPPAR